MTHEQRGLSAEEYFDDPLDEEPSRFPIVPVVIAAALLVICVVAAYALTRPPSPAATLPPPPADLAPINPEPISGELPPHGAVDPNGPTVDLIDPERAYDAMLAAQAVLVDVRASSAYSAAHIGGAFSLSSPELNTALAALPPDGLIITYGDAARPDAALRAAQIFIGLEYRNVVALDGGIDAWQAAGLPTEAAP